MNKNKSLLILSGAALSMLAYTACGSESTSSQSSNSDSDKKSEESSGYETEDDLPSCSSKRDGDIELTTKKERLFGCLDGEWENIDYDYIADDADDFADCTSKRDGAIAFDLSAKKLYQCSDKEWEKISLDKVLNNEDPDSEASSSSKTSDEDDEDVKSSSSKKTSAFDEDDEEDDDEESSERSSSSKTKSSSSKAESSSSQKETSDCDLLFCGNNETVSLKDGQYIGRWYHYSDDFSSFSWPAGDNGEYGDFAVKSIAEYGAIKGTAHFVSSRGGYIGFGFGIEELDDRTGVPLDISSWGGLCVEYSSTASFKVSVSAYGGGDDKPLAVLTASSTRTVANLPWSDFSPEGWSAYPVSISAATAVAQHIGFSFETSASSETSFVIYKIGKYGTCN